MNLLVRKLKMPAAVVLLASLFFVSCEDPGKIGLNINPKSGAISAKYVEFVLPSTQVQFDPRSTLNSNSFQAGSYTDADFGTISSKSYTWLGVQSSTPTLSSNAAYVSTSMSIQFSSIYGSESELNEIESFEVYQLGEDLVDGVDYTRIDEISLGALIGNLDILIREKEDTLATDSLFNFALNDAFGESIFEKLKADDSVFDNDTAFNAFIKGIAIVPASSNNKILYFNTVTFNVKLNYTEVNAGGDTVDRTYSFNLGSRKFFHLNSDLSGTPLDGILPNNQDGDPADDFRYLQAGTMIALKVNYDSLFMFLDTVENIVIQKAFLSFGNIGVNQPGSGFPGSILGYFTDDNNTWPALAEVSTDSISIYSTLQDEFTTLGSPAFPGYYGSPQSIFIDQKDSLTFNKATMSNFIQNLHNGGYDDASLTPLEQRGEMLLFAPTSVSAPESSASYTFTNYFKVHKDSIKIKIHYAVPSL